MKITKGVIQATFCYGHYYIFASDHCSDNNLRKQESEGILIHNSKS